MFGWLFYTAYWVPQTGRFIEIEDYFNAGFIVLGSLFLVYLAYHERLSYKWDEDNDGLRWIAGAIFFVSAPYFIIDKIPMLSAAIVEAVGDQSIGLANLMGSDHALNPVDLGGNGDWYRTNYNPIVTGVTGTPIRIILSCAAIQSMFIFLGSVLAVKAKLKPRLMVLAVSLPTIYILNIVRNAVIIRTYDIRGASDAEFMHNYVMKTGSVIALVILAYIAFRLVPELLENIYELLDLDKRKPPQPPETTE